MGWLVMDLGKLQKNAKSHLKTNWSNAILGSLISVIVWGFLFLHLLDFKAGFLLFILFLPFMVGVAKFHYKLSYPKAAGWRDLFYGFYEKTYFRSLGGLVLQYFFMFWWTVLLVIPGLYKGIAYAMTPNILQDSEFSHLNIIQVITKSREIMNGHKVEYVVLLIRFLPWFLLSIITLGLGLFYTLPYFQQTKAEFYRELEKDIF